MTTATLTRKASEIREDLLALAERTDGIARASRDTRTEDQREELRNSLIELQALDALLGVATRNEALEGLGEPGDGPRGATRADMGAGSIYSPGEDFIRSEGFEAFSKRRSGVYEAEVRTLQTTAGNWVTTPDTTGAGLLRPVSMPAFSPAPRIRPQTYLRDILPSTPTGLSVVNYIQEQNYLSNVAGADWVNEAAQKPELQMQWGPARATIEKIAGWIPATYEILQDAPTIRGMIDAFLQDAVNFREDRGLLSGTGANGQPLGLMNTAGLQVQSYQGDPWTSLGLAHGLIENVEGNPGFTVMNTLDYWSLQTTRYATRFEGTAGGTASNAPFGTPPEGIWGVPVLRTNAIARGTALVGDPRGALILDREGVTIRVGDQHLDYFTTNKVAILAEKRVGLMVFRPDFMVQVAVA